MLKTVLSVTATSTNITGEQLKEERFGEAEVGYTPITICC